MKPQLDSNLQRQTASEKLKDLCTCGHSRAKHAHAAGFCQEIKPRYEVCLCDRFELAEPK
jgi:hypothetical protein